jgi:3-methylfumaryl-CoA hydratase
MRDVSDTDLEYLREWIGRTDARQDQVTASPVAALSATLDRDDPLPKQGDPLPLLWHWLFCVPIPRQADLAADGHTRLGGFLPPVPLSRRMYAGGAVDVHRTLRIGDTILRRSQIVDVTQKEGRTGRLVFVKVRHDISTPAGLALTEYQDLVYRERPGAADSAVPVQRAPEGVWNRAVVPDVAMLFRYSALTFNAYRIHYDRQYAIEVQGYPGLVVHGPLIATLLMDLLRRELPEAAVSSFSFRAVRALFDTEPFVLSGRPHDNGTSVRLWARASDGALAVDATASLARQTEPIRVS